ncbi:hypothetical protein IWQ62_006360 [Dispira parvispora]|uniref:histone acetyltransferase n=1 Tax=Dispira parvispora TaxID=1520584 RepID=A0A9W8APE2_9FUNG|nr:hypothetical protein IWQ62_006360 [Dispira parvispora]
MPHQTLEQSLLDLLATQGVSTESLELHSVCTKIKTCEPLYDNTTFSNQAVIKRLLLLTVQRDGEPSFVAGLMAYEYLVLRDSTQPVIVYIEKIDSSGVWAAATNSNGTKARGPMRPLVQAYMHYCLSKYNTRRPVTFYTCARTQPEYLFANSKANQDKRVLDDSQLVRWWYRTLDTFRPHTGATGRAHWLIPGLDATEAQLTVRSTGKDLTIPTKSKVNLNSEIPVTHETSTWDYGFPGQASQRAHEVIPRFPDDPKTRLLAKAEAATWTLEEFASMLAISEECGAGRRTGFFSLSFPKHHSKSDPAEVQELEDKSRCYEIPAKGWDTVLLLLFHQAMDFSTLDRAQRSTKRFLLWMSKKFRSKPLALRTLSVKASPKVTHKDPDAEGSGPPSKKSRLD